MMMVGWVRATWGCEQKTQMHLTSMGAWAVAAARGRPCCCMVEGGRGAARLGGCIRWAVAVVRGLSNVVLLPFVEELVSPLPSPPDAGGKSPNRSMVGRFWWWWWPVHGACEGEAKACETDCT